MMKRNEVGATPVARPLLSAMALALVVAAPAAAQVGVMDQPFRNDLFQPLLSGRWSITHYLSADVANNTLGVGDMVALSLIAEDFRPSDIFLVAGLVPAGEGVKLGTQERTGLMVAFPVGPYLTLGVTGGGRVLGYGHVPDDVAALVRDGITGEEITVDLTEMGGEVFGYAEAGGSILARIPLLRTPFGDLELLGGGGARYVRSVSHVRVGFAGDDGDQTSTFTLTRTGVSTSLNLTAPLGEEVLAESGGGIAADLMVGAALGHMAQLRLSVTDLGSADALVGERAVTTVTIEDASFVDFGSATDSAAVTDTLPGGTRTVPLPTTLRADATFRPLDLVGVGVRVAIPMNEDAIALEPLFQAAVELRPLRALPLRAGVTGGGDFGTGYFAGLGLDTRVIGFDLELATSGGPALASIRGVGFRSALSIRF